MYSLKSIQYSITVGEMMKAEILSVMGTLT